MSIVSDVTNKKYQHITKCVRNFSHLAEQAGFLSESRVLACYLDEIERDGIFQLLIIGKSRNGKSTFINALAGSRMMATKATVCTGIITVIESDEENVVRIEYDDYTTKTITVNEFREAFSFCKEYEEESPN